MKKADKKKLMTIVILIAIFVAIYYLRMSVTGETYSPFDGFMAFIGN